MKDLKKKTMEEGKEPNSSGNEIIYRKGEWSLECYCNKTFIELEDALKQVFASDNPFDNPTLDITTYINNKFPDGRSLTTIFLIC